MTKEDIKQSIPDVFDLIDQMIDKIAETVLSENPAENTPERNTDNAEMERWEAIAKRGHLSIEMAEQIDQSVTQLEHGNIVLNIQRHEISSFSASPSTKTVTRHRNGNRTLQLPKRESQRQKKLDTN
jgi:hypothetical protein